MGDQLEKFILEHKDEFNQEVPSERVWSGIDRSLKKENHFLQLGWKVAAVLFLVSTLYLLIDKQLTSGNEGPTFSQEFQQAEDYYTQLISKKREEIAQQLTPQQQKDFVAEIDELDKLYLELKETYRTNATNERLLDAMINNLQIRLSILDKQLMILENLKEKRDESDAFTI